MTTLNNIGLQLAHELARANDADDSERQQVARSEKVNVVGAGGALTAAYEQLRNAAENTEEHLLLQNAIRRFYKQLFVARDENLVRTSGNELAVELTFAGYVANDTLTKEQLAEISRLASAHYDAYEALLRHRSIGADKPSGWVLDTLSVGVESILSSHRRDNVFIDVAYRYYESLVPVDEVATDQAQRDQLLKASFTDTLYHIVDRQGAPLRIIRRMLESRSDMVELLQKRESFLEAFEQQVTKEYGAIGKRINRAIVRSVIFLIITKFLIGLSIEVPYDLWAQGKIVWMPLLINLAFPPLYMVALRLTHTLPGYANTTALVDRADAMLYGERTTLVKRQLSGRRYGPVFSITYALISFIVFAGVTALLLMAGFHLVHIAIFFIFISAASFLGFRLSR